MGLLWSPVASRCGPRSKCGSSRASPAPVPGQCSAVFALALQSGRCKHSNSHADCESCLRPALCGSKSCLRQAGGRCMLVKAWRLRAIMCALTASTPVAAGSKCGGAPTCLSWGLGCQACAASPACSCNKLPMQALRLLAQTPTALMCHLAGDRGCKSGKRARLHHGAAPGVRHGVRRPRLHAVRRPGALPACSATG